MKSIVAFWFIVLLILSCKKNKADELIAAEERRRPVANAGVDQNFELPQTRVILDGSKSTDPESRPLVYKWRQVRGPINIQLYNSVNQSSQSAQLVVDLHVTGEYIFELTVSNTYGLTDTDVVKITLTHGVGSAHPIDLVFSTNASCTISGNFYFSPYSDGYFDLEATAASGVSGTQTSAVANISQLTEGGYFFDGATLRLSETSNGSILLHFGTHINFFELPYNGSAANFADSVIVVNGTGQFANIKKGSRIYCSGVADTTRNTGSLRLQGTLYY